MPALNRNPHWTPSAKAALGSAAAFLALFAAFKLDLFHTSGLPRVAALVIMTGMLALGFALFGWSMLLARKEKPLIDEEAIRPHADLLAGFRWRYLLFRVLVVLGLAPFVQWSITVGFHPTMRFWIALPTILFFVGVQSLFQLVSGSVMGEGIDDELTESFRAQAWRLGFKILLIALSFAYILSYLDDLPWPPPSLGASIPYVLALGASAAAFKFARLERAAGNG
ncbi:MAG TPA: hypothetical protein VGE93_08240 [Bryobacteraceae bacterium]